MTNTVVYINAKQNAEVIDAKVCVRDIASVYCAQKEICDKIKALKVFQFTDGTSGKHGAQAAAGENGGKKAAGAHGGQAAARKTGKSGNRQVIGILKIIQLIEAACPGVMVESVGENAVLVEYVKVPEKKGLFPVLKLLFVACISFFGTAFTIAAFHNDININKLFSRVYELVMGRPGEGFSILEVSYSIGLTIGIIVFFNHIGGRRITKDPTPIEVEMREYETLVNTALIETADREGKTIDVS